MRNANDGEESQPTERPAGEDSQTTQHQSISTQNNLSNQQSTAQLQIENNQAQPLTMADEWKSDPLQGDFNPGTKLGKDIFLEKTKGLPENERLELNRKNASQLHRYFRARESRMGICIRIPTEFNADGTVKTTKNLLTQYHSIKLADCQRAAHGRYATKLGPTDPIPAAPFASKDLKPATNEDDKKQFYSKVHSNVVARIIENALTATGYADLMLSQKHFAFTNPSNGVIEYDGPTMAFLLYKKIDPDTVVGLDSIERKLESATLPKFGNDVNAVLNNKEANFQILKENDKAPDKYRKLLLDALVSGPNHNFNLFIQ